MEKREIVSNISYVETFKLKQQNICYLVNIIELLIVLLDSICRVRTLFQKQFSRTFPGLFQASDYFSRTPKFTLTLSLS